jgi:hypothetical protein
MPHQELIEATNQLFRLRARGDEVSVLETVAVLELSCAAMIGLLDDLGLAAGIDRAAAQQRLSANFTPADGKAIEDLCKTFLRTEPELLHAAGLSDGAIRSLMDAGRETLTACASATLDVAQLYVGLVRLERRICGRAAQIRHMANEKDMRSAAERVVARGAVGVGGAAIVAINAGGVVAVPITAAMAAVSAVFGGELVKAAIGASWDE